jgi:hypothetical protein
VKVLLDPATERILGASDAGRRLGARALVDLEAVHPSFAEGLQSAVILARYALS